MKVVCLILTFLFYHACLSAAEEKGIVFFPPFGFNRPRPLFYGV